MLDPMKIVMVLLLSLLVISPLKAESLRIVTENFPPYNFQVADEARGLSSEVVQAVLKQINLQVSIEFYPWSRAYETAQAEKNILIYSIARIVEREALFHWVGTIAPYRTSLFKLKLNKSILVNSIAQAKKYEISVSSDDVISTYLQRHQFPSLKTVGSDILSIRLLANNRIDLIASDEASFYHRLQDEGLDASLFERVFRFDEISDQLYMAFSLSSDIDLVTAFRDGLEVIKMNGEYDEIQMKYHLSHE
jgi:polar amino acid transport system substrate-binding protein